MKVIFIYPRFEKFLESVPDLDKKFVEHYLGNFTTPPSLGIPILAALTPSEWEMELIDDNNGDPVDYGAEADLVAINCFTPQATRAFEIADGFRAAGKTVVMGGFFPSTLPEAALEHSDSVNIGDGEPTWLQILEDANKGTLQKKYKGGTRYNLAEMPFPRRDLFYEKTGYDWNEDIVQVARGCTYNCSMCAIPSHQGHRIRLRPVDQIVKEIEGLKYDNIYLAEDILFFRSRRINEWSRELLDALAPLGKKYFVSSTMALNTSDEFLDLVARAGVTSFYCTLNVDSKSIRALNGDETMIEEAIDLVHRIEDRGMRFFASFGMGRDWDGPGLVDMILELCHRANIRTAEFFLFTPYPGSPHFDRLERQGRILHRRWNEYNGAHVVSKPLAMEPEQLYEMFIAVWHEFFSTLSSIDVTESLEPNRSDDQMQRRRHRVGRED
ncbi:MAG: radical SAM protein [Deltaproteobacteria bacterium]|nr:radical SAM protein [Deltaproteobacteria bacterium]